MKIHFLESTLHFAGLLQPADSIFAQMGIGGYARG